VQDLGKIFMRFWEFSAQIQGISRK